MLGDWGTSRCDLERLAGPYIRALIEQGWILKGPEAARGALAAGGDLPNVAGDNIRSIQLLRNCIDRVGGWKLANALMIVAPHTHWSDNVITIWRKPRSRSYSIGPIRHAPPQSRFAPASFVFGPTGIMPFEWAEVSGLGSRRDYMHVCAMLERLNGLVVEGLGATPPVPIGVSLATRFKRLFDPPIVGTMEVPDATGPLARIKRDTLSDQVAMESGGQVAWSAHTVPAEASADDIAAAADLADCLRALPPKQAEKIYAQLRAIADHAAA